MDLRKVLVKRAIVWLVLGLVGGGVAADMWWRQRAAQDQTDLQSRHADQLRHAESQIRQLTEQLSAERQRREALERVLSESRK